MTTFRFESPWLLLLFVPIWGMTVWSQLRRRSPTILFSNIGLLQGLPTTPALWFKPLVPYLRTVGLSLVVFALARPQQGTEEFRVRTEGIAIEMCIDKSGSMQALDFDIAGERVNRLEAVKKVFHDFVAGDGELNGRSDDKIGLIAFGGFADALCPLTLDHPALLSILETVKIPALIHDHRGRPINESLVKEEMSTAIGDALVLAIDRLKGIDAKSKVVILLSDGENNAGTATPDEAAEAAKALGIKIYSIGIGSTGLAPFPGKDLFGRPGVQRQPVRLDEAVLRKISETTGGAYFNAKDSQALHDVYDQINKLEKSTSEGKIYTHYRELFGWPLLPGMALVALETLLSLTRFRSLP